MADLIVFLCRITFTTFPPTTNVSYGPTTLVEGKTAGTLLRVTYN